MKKKLALLQLLRFSINIIFSNFRSKWQVWPIRKYRSNRVYHWTQSITMRSYFFEIELTTVFPIYQEILCIKSHYYKKAVEPSKITIVIIAVFIMAQAWLKILYRLYSKSLVLRYWQYYLVFKTRWCSTAGEFFSW